MQGGDTLLNLRLAKPEYQAKVIKTSCTNGKRARGTKIGRVACAMSAILHKDQGYYRALTRVDPRVTVDRFANVANRVWA